VGHGYQQEARMNKPVCLITGASGKLGQALTRSLCGSYDIVALVRTLPTFSARTLKRLDNRGWPRPCNTADFA
jgi:nucleoside-diphosphate-sugar epimerase